MCVVVVLSVEPVEGVSGCVVGVEMCTDAAVVR